MEVSLNDTLNQAWKNDKSGFGFKMLQKMGWKEENGLGKNQDGMKSAIKVKKREEGLGIGMVHDSAGNHGWGATATSFNEVLDMLKVTYGTKKKKGTKKVKSKIQVGIKYHKLSAAKDLSTKTDADMRSILGNAVHASRLQQLVTSSTSTSSSSVLDNITTSSDNNDNSNTSSSMNGDEIQHENLPTKKRKRIKEKH
eukprot:gene8761-18125_t